MIKAVIFNGIDCHFLGIFEFNAVEWAPYENCAFYSFQDDIKQGLK